MSLCLLLNPCNFLFYILVFLPPDGKKKISFSISYSFPIRILRARFEAGNVRIQRSLFLEKLYKLKSSFQRHQSCNFWTSETWDMGHNPRQHFECKKFGSDSIPVFRLALWASKQQKWVIYMPFICFVDLNLRYLKMMTNAWNWVV
jgi:hypothetical protein